jgi:hypothetical protein
LLLVIGWVTAWIVERTNTPLKGARLSHRDHLARHALHPLVTAWLSVLRQGRPVNHLYRTLTGNTDV